MLLHEDGGLENGMLEFHNGYAGDQSGVRVAAHDRGRRILFRVEKHVAIKALGLQPGLRASFETLMEEHVPDVRRACRRAYLAGPNSDHLTLIRLEPHHFGHC
jgi:hypothetical protein